MMRPRQYAQEVVTGNMPIDAVPAEYRGMVQTMIDRDRQLIEHYAARVISAPTKDQRRARLATCPQHLIEQVELRAREMWGEK